MVTITGVRIFGQTAELPYLSLENSDRLWIRFSSDLGFWETEITVDELLERATDINQSASPESKS